MRSTSCLVASLCLLLACGDDDNKPNIPEQLDSSFEMNRDSLPFANFATGYDSSRLDVTGLRRMFGDEVCAGGSTDPCQLTAGAAAFMDEANSAMTGGRCEGFAVLSSLMEAGEVAAEEFGGATARELTLEGNAELQRELAYWFATQLIPSAVSDKTKQYMSKDVMPFLVKALSPDAKERYRIGIVRKTANVVSGGHSLTPVGYYQDSEDDDVYWVRVYDNNNPDFEKLLKVDVGGNRWEFEAAENPERGSRLYYGDTSNGNPLYFAPILSRQGVQECSFCDDGGVAVSSNGGAQVIVDTPVGPVGLSEGDFVSVDGTSVTPSFSAELDTEPTAVVIGLSRERRQELADNVVVRVKAPEDPENPGVRQSVGLLRDNLRTVVSDLKVGFEAEDKLTTSASGSAFENNSGSDLTLTTQVPTATGTLSLSVSVAGSSDKVSTDIDADTGGVAVAVDGSNGTEITVVTTSKTTAGEERTAQVTFVSEGDVAVEADTSTWSGDENTEFSAMVSNGGTMTMVSDACTDGRKSGLESDVDCGSVCDTKCGLGLNCGEGADCESGYCNGTSGVCVENSCLDGVKSGNETDVDCGGPDCDACVLGSECTENTDCDLDARCIGGFCSETYLLGVAVDGLTNGDGIVLQNNGGDDLEITGNGSFYFGTRIVGAYDVSLLEGPDFGECLIENGAGTATTNAEVSIRCYLNYSIGGTLTNLGASETLTLALDNELLPLSADGPFTFATKVEGSYVVTVATQPINQTCSVYGGIGTATDDVSSVEVQCCIPGVTGMSCDRCAVGHGVNPPICTEARCGDGYFDIGEECDDGNLTAMDGCSDLCQIEAGFVCDTPVPIYTGSDNGGGQAALSSNDLLWTYSDTLTSARLPALVTGDCAPGSWVIPPSGTSQWIGRGTCDTTPAQSLTWYHVSFTLATLEGAEATTIDATMWVDNRLDDIVVNGVSTGLQTADLSFTGPGFDLGSVPSSLFIQGENTLSFGVFNEGTDPNSDGILVDVANAFGAGSTCAAQ